MPIKLWSNYRPFRHHEETIPVLASVMKRNIPGNEQLPFGPRNRFNDTSITKEIPPASGQGELAIDPAVVATLKTLGKDALILPAFEEEDV